LDLCAFFPISRCLLHIVFPWASQSPGAVVVVEPS
jgi:hypothetical protein